MDRAGRAIAPTAAVAAVSTAFGAGIYVPDIVA
jgi:hypothetical protein